MNPKLNKRAARAKKLPYETPEALSKKIAFPHSHLILYPTKSGTYSFKVFWIDTYEKSKKEVVGQSGKKYKTKAKCIVAIKKLIDAFRCTSDMSIACFDNHGSVISTTVRVEYKRFFE